MMFDQRVQYQEFESEIGVGHEREFVGLDEPDHEQEHDDRLLAIQTYEEAEAELEVDASPQSLSFEALCLPWVDEIRRYAAKLTKNRHDADDLLQLTMLRAFSAWPRWRPVGDPDRSARAWLHVVCKRSFIKIYHSRGYAGRRTAAKPHEVLAATYGTYRDGRDPREQDDGVGDEVKAALERLEPRQREMIERCDFHGESYATIAREMGVPIGTVMSGLHRVRKRLAAELEGFAREQYRLERVAPVRRPARKDAVLVVVSEDDY